jgi:uncharacterized protein (UPF0276 family)
MQRHREAGSSGIPAAAGVEINPSLLWQILSVKPPVGWLALREGPRARCSVFRSQIAALRDQCPFALLGLPIPIGGDRDPDAAHLASLRGMIDSLDPHAVTAAFAWTMPSWALDADVLPAAYDEALLDRVARQIDLAQNAVGRRLLLENPATQVAFVESTMSEAEFLLEVAAQTGCGLLLDIDRALFSSRAHGRTPAALVAAIATGPVDQIRIRASVPGGSATDKAESVADRLFRQTINRLGPVPTLVASPSAEIDLGSLVAAARHYDDVISASTAHSPVA